MTPEQTLTNLGVLVAILISIGGFVRQWRADTQAAAKAQRETDSATERQQADTLKVRQDIEAALWLRVQEKLDRQNKRIDELEAENERLRAQKRTEVATRDRRIEELEERVAQLEDENRKLKGGRNGS